MYCSKHRIISAKICKRLQKSPKSLQKFAKVCKSLQETLKSAKVCKSLQKSAKVWKSLKKFEKSEKVWKSLQNSTRVWKSLQSLKKSAKVCKSLQKSAKVYKSLQNSKSLQKSSQVCKSLQNSAKLYKSLQLSRLKTITFLHVINPILSWICFQNWVLSERVFKSLTTFVIFMDFSVNSYVHNFLILTFACTNELQCIAPLIVNDGFYFYHYFVYSLKWSFRMQSWSFMQLFYGLQYKCNYLWLLKMSWKFKVLRTIIASRSNFSKLAGLAK